MLRHYLILLLLPVAIFTQCQTSITVEQEPAQAGVGVDTVEVTSFDLQRESSPELADWKTYEVNQEIIAVPPDWNDKIEDQTFIITPPHSEANQERLSLARYDNDMPASAYDKFAWQRCSQSFQGFTREKSERFKKIELQRDVFYEQDLTLSKDGIKYAGYYLAYVNDSSFYEYNLVLTQTRLKAYDGDLKQDIIGNLQIRHKYVFDNGNPMKKVIYINP